MNPEEHVIDQINMRELENKVVANGKSFLLLIALLFVACLVSGCVSLLVRFRFVGWLQLAGLLFLGCVYIAIAQKRLADEESPSQFLKAVYFALALFFAFSVVYFSQAQFDFLDVFALSCAFLLPATIFESWDAFNAIPKNEKSIWYVSNDIPPLSNLRYIENTKVKLRLVIDEAKAVKVETSLPTTLELGRAVYYIIKSQDPFQEGDGTFFKTNGEPYGWVFYTKNLFSKTYFIPHETIFNNHIKPNSVIYAERIS
jgi:hypothetical protein